MTKFAIRGLLSRKLRTALTAIAIVLGVAMVCGTYVLTDSISQAFDAIFASTYENTDAVVTGKRAFTGSDSGNAVNPSFDESLLPKVKALPDVAAALGGVQGDAHLIGENGKAIVFGGAPNIGFSVDPAQPQFNSLTLVKGSWPGHDELVVDESTAGKKDLQVGQTIGVQSRGPVETYRISGIARYGAVSSIGGATLAGFDLPTAQSLFDKVGQLDQIRISAKSGVSPEELVAQVKQILPKDTQVKTGTAQAASDASDTTDFLSVLQKILLGFGLVALFVGAFVIANSLSITIAQRTREFATLRTIGASRSQILRSVIVEAFVVGVVASLVGLFFGLGLAKGLFKLFDVAGLTLPNNGLTLETRTIVVSLALGILVTLLASVYPGIARDDGPADRGRARRSDAPERAARRHPGDRQSHRRDGGRRGNAGAGHHREARRDARHRRARSRLHDRHALRLRALPVENRRGARVRRARPRRSRLRPVRLGPRGDSSPPLDRRRGAARVLRVRAGGDPAHPRALVVHVPDRTLVRLRAQRRGLAVLHVPVLVPAVRLLGPGGRVEARARLLRRRLEPHPARDRRRDGDSQSC